MGLIQVTKANILDFEYIAETEHKVLSEMTFQLSSGCSVLWKIKMQSLRI